jgi:hypothetical protein
MQLCTRRTDQGLSYAVAKIQVALQKGEGGTKWLHLSWNDKSSMRSLALACPIRKVYTLRNLLQAFRQKSVRVLCELLIKTRPSLAGAG